MSAHGRYCYKSLKRRSGQFLAKEPNNRKSPINTASNPLRESPVSLARGDLSPHIIIQSPRLRGGEFESHLQKRLLQHYLPGAEVGLEHRSRVSLSLDLVAQSLPRVWYASFDRVGTGFPGHAPLGIGRQASAHPRLQFVAFLDRHCFQWWAHAPRNR